MGMADTAAAAVGERWGHLGRADAATVPTAAVRSRHLRGEAQPAHAVVAYPAIVHELPIGDVGRADIALVRRLGLPAQKEVALRADLVELRHCAGKRRERRNDTGQLQRWGRRGPCNRTPSDREVPAGGPKSTADARRGF